MLKKTNASKGFSLRQPFPPFPLCLRRPEKKSRNRREKKKKKKGKRRRKTKNENTCLCQNQKDNERTAETEQDATEKADSLANILKGERNRIMDNSRESERD